MNLSNCKHVRIKENSGSEMSVDTLIKVIESKFKTNFTSLPRWKEIIKYISDQKYEYKSKIDNAGHRKMIIIDKIHKENFRPSPFMLTDNLARTANLWRELESRRKKQRDNINLDTEFAHPVDIHGRNNPSGEASNVNLTVHPNSEVVMTENIVPVRTTVEAEAQSSLISHLPVSICTNHHKLISPLESELSALNLKMTKSAEKDIFETHGKDWVPLIQNKSVKCIPCAIIIDINKTSLKNYKVKLTLSNRSDESLFIQFKFLSDLSPFKKVFVHPVTCSKLYPGLAKVFTFCYKLASEVKPFESFLYFHVGRTATTENAIEFLRFPVYSKREGEYLIDVTETIKITPVYAWQISVNSNFPKGTLQISVNDEHSYYMHVRKREVDFVKETELFDASVNITSLNTASVLQRLEDDDFEGQSGVCSVSRKDILLDKVEATTDDIISLVVEDIIRVSLDSFVFEKTCLYVCPHTRLNVPVYFLKPEHVGLHQCYYDLNFYDPNSQHLVISKTIKVYAEVLPHPLQIHPTILDMSRSPISYGFREDRIVITNNHKIYAATLKIKLTKKMEQLITIHPMETTVRYNSSASFIVRLCSKKININEEVDDMVHFTIKMIITGHESLYRNVPPIFYEIIAPCTPEFNDIDRIL